VQFIEQNVQVLSSLPQTFKKKIELPKYSSNNLYDIVLDQHEREERVLILSRTFALRDEDYI